MTHRRVVHVVDSLAATGGAELRLVEEVEALGGRFEQRVVRLYGRDELQSRVEAAGVPVAALGFAGAHAGRTWPVAAYRLRAVLADWPPDIVHTTLFSGNLVGQLAAASRRVPVVSSFNRTGDIELQRALQPGVAGWKGRTMQAVASHAARLGNVHFRAVSAHARDSNCRLFDVPTERVTVVPRGVDVVVPEPVPTLVQLGLPDTRPLFVNAARIVPEKAQHLLVDAFAVVRAAIPTAQLVIAGAAGSAEPAVREAIAAHGLEASVRMLGWRADIHGLVAAADVFAFSSLSEGSPSAVLEALALGTPVVAFAIAPVVEVTGGHAVLVPPGSVRELATAMVATARSTDRARDVAAGRAWASRFTVAAVAEQLGDLLESRIGTGRPPRRESAPGPATGSASGPS